MKSLFLKDLTNGQSKNKMGDVNKYTLENMTMLRIKGEAAAACSQCPIES